MSTHVEMTKSPLPVIIAITILHLGLVLVPYFFSWQALLVTFVLYFLTLCLGITLGYHRLLSHRSFDAPKWLEYLFATFGALSLQGGPIEWIGEHRMHHKHSDGHKDPHNAKKGFWWCHVGWLFHNRYADEVLRKHTKDLNGDPYYEFIHKYHVLMQIMLGVILYLIGGWGFVVYGIFLRLVLCFHATWFVNSVSHRFGYRNYQTKDNSRNCWWVAILAFGEGWHNNHHAYPYSAKQGLKWWEFDITWMVIWVLKKLHLIDRVKIAKKLSRLKM